MRCVKGRGVKEDLKSISEWVSACPLSYLLSSNWYLPNYTHTHAHTRMHGYSHTVFFPPSISRPHQTNPPNRPPAIHLQSTAVDTQESRPTHTHTLMLFLPPWQEGLSSEPDDSLCLSPFPLLAGVRNKTINKCKSEPETARESRTQMSVFICCWREGEIWGKRNDMEDKSVILSS